MVLEERNGYPLPRRRENKPEWWGYNSEGFCSRKGGGKVLKYKRKKRVEEQASRWRDQELVSQGRKSRSGG